MMCVMLVVVEWISYFVHNHSNSILMCAAREYGTFNLCTGILRRTPQPTRQTSSFLLQSISNASRLFGSCLLAGHTVVTNSTACDTVIMFLLFTCPKFKKMTSQKSNLDYYVC